MNPATRCRLKKEARALLPFWAAIAAWMFVAFVLRSNDPLAHGYAAYVFACALLGPVCIGHEFNDRTMSLLLSQPVSRRRLWWEKMAVLGAGLLGLVLLLAVLSLSSHVSERIPKLADEEVTATAAFLVIPLLFGFCTGPALTLLARGTIGGVALTFFGPCALALLAVLLVPPDEVWQTGRFTTGDQLAVFFSLFVAPCLYLGGLVLFGCWRFQRLEDTGAPAQEVSLPAMLARPFGWLADALAPVRGSAMGNLIRKELRLQQPAFIFALAFVAMWMVTLALSIAGVAHAREFLIAPSAMLCLVVPVIVGVVSTAEERNLGVHEWQLTMPLSASRQWFVKVFVTLAVNAVLGLLLAWMLLSLSMEWFGLRNTAPQDLKGFWISNCILFCASFYVSSAASDGLRAVVGAIVLFGGGGLAIQACQTVQQWLAVLSQHGPRSLRIAAWREVWDRVEPAYWLGVWTVLALWLGAATFRNYRNSLGPIGVPLRRIAFFLLATILLCAVGWSWHLVGLLFHQYWGE